MKWEIDNYYFIYSSYNNNIFSNNLFNFQYILKRDTIEYLTLNVI